MSNFEDTEVVIVFDDSSKSAIDFLLSKHFSSEIGQYYKFTYENSDGVKILKCEQVINTVRVKQFKSVRIASAVFSALLLLVLSIWDIPSGIGGDPFGTILFMIVASIYSAHMIYKTIKL